MSDILGIKRSTYAYYETNTYPPLSIMKKLANMYKISIDELTGGNTSTFIIDGPTNSNILIAKQPQTEYNPTVSPHSADETELLMLYRILPTDKRSQVKDILHDIVKKLEN